MADIRVEKLADLLVNYSVGVKPGDKVVIQGETSGEPLIRQYLPKSYRRWFTVYDGDSPGMEELVYKYVMMNS